MRRFVDENTWIATSEEALCATLLDSHDDSLELKRRVDELPEADPWYVVHGRDMVRNPADRTSPHPRKHAGQYRRQGHRENAAGGDDSGRPASDAVVDGHACLGSREPSVHGTCNEIAGMKLPASVDDIISRFAEVIMR